MTPVILPAAGLTLAAYRSRLQAHGVDASKTAAINDAINIARSDVFAERRWPFLEDQAAPTVTIIGEPTVSLTALPDIDELDAVRLSDNTGEVYDLEYIQPSHLAALAVDTVNGTPEYWTLYANSVQLYPRPDRAYGVELDFLLSPPDLVEDTDACPIPRAHANVVVWGAMASIATRQRDWNAASYATNERDKRMAQMAKKLGLRQRQSSGRVREV